MTESGEQRSNPDSARERADGAEADGSGEQRGHNRVGFDSTRISRHPSRPVNDDSPKVVDVGEGGSGDQKVADLGKKPSRIVIGQKRGGIEAKSLGARGGIAGRIGAGGVGGGASAAIRAIGVAGE